MSVEASLPVVIRAKKNTGAYGADEVPAAIDSILIQGEPTWKPDFTHTAQDENAATLGLSKGYVAKKSASLSFNAYLRSSGSCFTTDGGTESRLGRLLEGCGMIASFGGTAPNGYRRYSLDSDISNHPDLTIYAIPKGGQRKFLGARGSFGLSYDSGESPLFTFNFKSLYAAATALSWPSPHADYEDTHPMIAIGVAYTQLVTAQPVLHFDMGKNPEPTLIDDSAGTNGVASFEILKREIPINLTMAWSPALEVALDAVVDAETRHQLKLVFQMPGVSTEYFTLYFANVIYTDFDPSGVKDGFRTISMSGMGYFYSGDDEFTAQFGGIYTP